MDNFVDSLKLVDNNKEELNLYFDTLWSFIKSGKVKLALDLHIKYNNKNYNIDFKNGFSSNEKGNIGLLLILEVIV